MPLTERLAAYRNHLRQRLFRIPGATGQALADATTQIDRVLRIGLSLGLSDAGLLDYFYADERLRRWGTTAERRGVISPLLTPAFVRAAFTLRPQQRLEAALHKGVLRHLIPVWADVPFFKPSRGAAATNGGNAMPAPTGPPPEPFRLGLATDADRLDPIFDLPSRWAGDIDHQVIGNVWTASRAGRSTATEELALWRVVWRDLFHDHLAQTLGGSADPRESVDSSPMPVCGQLAQGIDPTTRASGPGTHPGDTARRDPRAPTPDGTDQVNHRGHQIIPRTQVKRLVRRARRTRAGRALRRSRLGSQLAAALRRGGLTDS